MFKEYDHYDAVGLAQLVRDREVSPEQLLEEAIARVERSARVNSVVNRLYDHARAAIRAGLPDGPLRGVPFLLKDLNALCDGGVTSNGCRFFADNVADHDTELVARYKRGGAVIFGKTNTPEFGLTITTEPKLFGATRNPVACRTTPQAARAAVRLRRSRPGSGAGCACFRRRRVDPHSGFVLRRVRPEADARAQSARALIAARAGPV